MYDFLIDIVPQPLMKPSKLVGQALLLCLVLLSTLLTPHVQMHWQREHEQVQRVWFMKEMERQAEEAQRRREVAERLREEGGDVTSTQGGLNLSSLRGAAAEGEAPVRALGVRYAGVRVTINNAVWQVEQGLPSGGGLQSWREHQRALALLQAQATGQHVPRAPPQGRVPVHAIVNGAQHPPGAHAAAMLGDGRSGGAGEDAGAGALHAANGRGDGTPRHASRSMGHYV